MSLLFISHSSKNNPEAIAIRDWLVTEGWNELFLDLDPERGILAAERWELALHQAAKRCDAVLFLVSNDWLASEWCRKEFRLAHRLNKRIVGLLIDDKVCVENLPQELTETWQLVDLAQGWDHETFYPVLPSGKEHHVTFSRSGLTRLRGGLVKAGLDPRYFVWPPNDEPERPPYRGMRPLEAEDAGIFFGREAPIIDMLARARGLAETVAPRMLVILGASGAGKSSFLRAGILPRLQRDDRNFMPLPVIRPETAVLTGDNGMLRCLEQIFKLYQIPANPNRKQLREALESGGNSLIQLLLQLADKAKVPALQGETTEKMPTLVLSIDQAEELFTLDGQNESQRFLEILGQLAIAEVPGLLILCTIRSDTYEYLQTAPALRNINQQVYSLPPLPQGAYQTVIEGPAARLTGTKRQLKIDPALTQRLLHDIEQGGGKDALPLLAFTLELLYEEYGGNGDLRLDEYEHMGGIEGAIEEAVKRALNRADADPAIPREHRARLALLRRGLIPWLAGIDPETKMPRRRVAKLEEIPAEARPLIKHLIEKRLLATDVDESNGERTIEPAHEALLRQWGLLQGWLKEDFAALTILEGVKRAATDYEANNRNTDWLVHRGEKLEDAESFLQRDDLADYLTQSDRYYLFACREQDNVRKSIENDVRHNLGLALAEKANRAFAEGIVNEGHLYVAHSLAHLDRDRSPDDYASLIGKRIARNDMPLIGVRELAESATGTAVSRDGRTLAVSARNVIYVWKESVGEPCITLTVEGHKNVDDRIAISPDGTTLAAITRTAQDPNQNTAHFWNLSTGSRTSFDAGSGWMGCIAFSENGCSLLTAVEITHSEQPAYTASIRTWDIATGLLQREISWQQNTNGRLSAFSPDANTIAEELGGLWIHQGNQVYNQPMIRLRDLNNLSNDEPEYRDLTDPRLDKVLYRVLFSLNGRTLGGVAGHPEKGNIFFLWDLISGKQYPAFEFRIMHNAAALSPDGSILAAWCGDKRIVLWDVVEGKTLAILTGHLGRVTCLEFFHGGATLMVGSDDHAVRFWDVSHAKPTTPLGGPRTSRGSLGLAKDGRILMATAQESNLTLWNTINGNAMHLSGNRENISTVSFSPEGRLLAAAFGNGGFKDDYAIFLWDAATGLPQGYLTGHKTHIKNLALSSDGKIVAGCDGGPSTYVWNVATRELIFSITNDFAKYVAISPDDRLLALGNKSVRLFSLENGQEIAVLNENPESVHRIAFSPDCRSLAVQSNEAIYLWDIEKNNYRVLNTRKDISPTEITFSSDGSKLAAGFSSLFYARVYVWDLLQDKVLVTFDETRNSRVSGIVFSQDGNTLSYLCRGLHSRDLRELAITDWHAQAAVDEASYGLKLEGITLVSWTPTSVGVQP